ncbi:MAG: flagellar hook-length control protein FliK [Deltaproteobacteria bacterium]|nr:flagellar hook-length control protein FliK [Deltaproteobacteria bacterium]
MNSIPVNNLPLPSGEQLAGESSSQDAQGSFAFSLGQVRAREKTSAVCPQQQRTAEEEQGTAALAVLQDKRLDHPAEAEGYPWPTSSELRSFFEEQGVSQEQLQRLLQRFSAKDDNNDMQMLLAALLTAGGSRFMEGTVRQAAGAGRGETAELPAFLKRLSAAQAGKVSVERLLALRQQALEVLESWDRGGRSGLQEFLQAASAGSTASGQQVAPDAAAPHDFLIRLHHGLHPVKKQNGLAAGDRRSFSVAPSWFADSEGEGDVGLFAAQTLGDGTSTQQAKVFSASSRLAKEICSTFQKVKVAKPARHPEAIMKDNPLLVSYQESAAAAAGASRGDAVQSPLPPGRIPFLELPVQLGQRLLVMASAGQYRTRLRLHPPELGQIQLEIHLKKDHLTATLVAESHAVKELIEAHLLQLRQHLAQHNLHLESFQVSVNRERSPYPQLNEDRFQENKRGGAPRISPVAPSGTGEEEPSVQQVERLISGRRVDLFA